MAAHTVRLVACNQIAEGTTAFHFAKPAGFEFRPGQAVDVVLEGEGAPPDAQDCRHTFSLVSAPYQDELVVATRMRNSPFKRAFGAWQIGSTLGVDGPFGSLTLHKNAARPAVMIAGGIGITPFMSMVRQAAKDRAERDLLLIYSNRRPEDAAFLSELQQLQKTYPRFRLVAAMTDMAHSAQTWTGETRKIDGALIRSAIKDLPASIFYLAGPPAMVEAVRQALADAGMDEDDVRSEAFYGY
ncbi:MAG TPA: FAD-dependent oxidoreductase [Bordetella sp.]|uniref:ferredoxin--NADP reductase n=1 Tax=Bordetella sp. TaxID=28081 RepID=UPI002ED3E1AA